MKRKIPLLLGATFLAFSAMACEGPVGPEGPAGPAGEPGAPGEPGLNALNTCSDCHSSDATIMAVEHQFNNSPHAPDNFEYRGPSYAGGSCVACHTHQGFVEATTGVEADWSQGGTVMNCRTCHQIHSDVDGDGDLDVGDYALTTTDPVELRLNGETVDFTGTHQNVEYQGNLCAECHQGRRSNPWPSPDAPMSQMFNVTSTHFGPHYGTQSNVLAASVGIEFDGPRTIPDGKMTHGTSYTCTGCHMSNPSPTEGGHTWQVTTEVCTDCHSTATGSDFDFFGIQTATTGLLQELEVCLNGVGLIEDGHLDTTGMFPEPVVAALVVWQAFHDDGSLGIHHPRYTVTMLENAINFMRNNTDGCD